ncbi:hypothetical protein G5639_09425 [Citrobacter freundii]|nr:hypothetical protein [Citrobacter freundii]
MPGLVNADIPGNVSAVR